MEDLELIEEAITEFNDNPEFIQDTVYDALVHYGADPQDASMAATIFMENIFAVGRYLKE